jgi:uncharacterized protein YwgA
MKPYDFVHLTIHAIGGQIGGRTKLQKTVYFLGVFTGELEQLGYRAHFYGPYSDLVANAVSRLKSLAFVTESTIGTGSIGADGFEISRHDFSLTEEGRAIASEKAHSNPGEWTKILEAVTRFKTAGDIDYMRMSVAAKTYFMLRESGKPATSVELSESAKALGLKCSPLSRQFFG